MRFESAIDQQRHNLKLLEAQSHNSMLETLFGSNWEAHAVKVYTHEVLFDFQEEVKFSVNACSVCGHTPPDPVTNIEVSIVEDANKRKRYAVEYNRKTMDVRCTCKLFERKGNLYNHIIWIFSGNFKEIPEKYILRRWSKNALRNPVYYLNGNLLENYDLTGNSKFGISRVWSEIYATAHTKLSTDSLQNKLRPPQEALHSAFVSSSPYPIYQASQND
ncbi:protein FAR1-RELATED SEQUENCE 9-like [Silene latifolia]|uniref:protein FAR1-RELATED SEQUENCE 9-like n=1 Tax=Silene latifolia TaxID=37657 RepID=UPI003D77BFF3